MKHYPAGIPPRLQLCCSAGLQLCSQLPQIKIWLQIHKLPKSNQSVKMGQKSLVINF